MTDPRAEKEHLRLAIDTRLQRMSEGDREAESRSVCRRILESLPQGPLIIGTYYPFPSEVNLRHLFPELRNRKDQIYLPCLENMRMVYRLYEESTVLIKGANGTQQPPPTSPELNLQELQLVLVPARAYNKNGDRLGRGNGGFDIWIRSQRQTNPQTKFWGVIYECQLVDQIPMEAHDERADAVITARGVLYC